MCDVEDKNNNRKDSETTLKEIETAFGSSSSLILLLDYNRVDVGNEVWMMMKSLLGDD